MENELKQIMEMIQGMQSEMKELKQDMNQRFDAMDKRFDGLKRKSKNYELK